MKVTAFLSPLAFQLPLSGQRHSSRPTPTAFIHTPRSEARALMRCSHALNNVALNSITLNAHQNEEADTQPLAAGAIRPNDTRQQAQLDLLFNELIDMAGWEMTSDSAGRETVSGTLFWNNPKASGTFETEHTTLVQPCNPILAQIADDFEIPYPYGSGCTTFHLTLEKQPDQSIQYQAVLQ